MTKQVNSNLIAGTRTGWRWLAGSFLCLLYSVNALAQTPDETLLKRCGVVEHERILQLRNPNRLREITELNRRIQQVETNNMSARQAVDETVYRIPVVVHVVHNTPSGAIGGAGNVNISDEQILSQIQVLNEDYRRKPGTNGFNTSPIGADARIEFFLATTDPTGQSSSGITRHYYPQKASFTIDDDVLLSQIAYWPSNRYLNIWVIRLDTYIGYTQFPTAADTLRGLPPISNEFTDGSLIDYRYFGKQTGTVSNSSLYALGRTATHEIGHWLGLIHTWGDGSGCADDYVADTPPTEDRSDVSRLTSCRQTYSTCVVGKQTRDLIEDYMNYWPDACMNLFTAGQVARMRAVMTLSPRRAQLLKSTLSPLPETEALTINVYPNPATSDPSIDIQLKGFQSFSVDLFDMTGRQVRTQTYTDSPSTRAQLPVSGLATGVYIVRVKTGSEMVSKRLLVQ